MPPVIKGAKSRIFPSVIYEEPSNVKDNVIPFEDCEFARYFLNEVLDLLNLKLSCQVSCDDLIKLLRETNYYDSSWDDYKKEYYPLIKNRIDSDFYKLSHSFFLIAINFLASLVVFPIISKETKEVAFGYSFISFCLLVTLKPKLNVIYNNYSILESLNNTNYSIGRLTKKLNKKNAMHAFFNKIKMLNNFKSNIFFDSYKYYLCSPNLNRFELPDIQHLDEDRLFNFYLYFNHYSEKKYKLPFLDSVVNQLSEATLRKGLLELFKGLINTIRRKEDSELLTEMLELAMAEESLGGIAEFLTSYEQLKKELFLFGF